MNSNQERRHNKLKELLTNDNGRLSTTAFIQFFGFIIAAVILVYVAYLDKDYLPDLYTTFFLGCLGGAFTKGMVTAVKTGFGRQAHFEERYDEMNHHYSNRNRRRSFIEENMED